MLIEVKKKFILVLESLSQKFKSEMKTIKVILFSIFLSSKIFSQETESEIKHVLDFQIKCWNESNIDCFMEGYWKSDSLMFIGKNGITYGWKNTLENYKVRYPDKDAMGELSFEILDMEILSKTYVTVVGKWSLKRKLGDIGGYFTLVFKSINNKWVIVRDHTS